MSESNRKVSSRRTNSGLCSSAASSRNSGRSSKSSLSRRSSKSQRSRSDVSSHRSVSPVADQKNVKYRKSPFLARAERKNKRLLSLGLLLALFQGLCLVFVAASGTYMYLKYSASNTHIYYISQTVMETIIFLACVMAACVHSRAVRVLILCLFLVALLSNAIGIGAFMLENNQAPEYFCGKTAELAGTQPNHVRTTCLMDFINVYYNILFVSLVLFSFHILLLLVSVVVLLTYEGSMMHYESTPDGQELIRKEREACIIGKKRKSHRSHSNSSKRRRHRKFSKGLKIPPGSTATQSYETRQTNMFVGDSKGEPVGVGAVVTSTIEISAETPTGRASKQWSKGKQFFKDGEGKIVERDMPLTIITKDEPHPIGKRSKKISEKSKKEKAVTPNRYNSVTKMPALESPIAYLSKNRNKSGQRSEYVV